MAKKKYFTEDERLEARRAYSRKWKAEHKLEVAEYMAIYRENHKAEIAEQQTNYRQEHKKDKAEYDARYRQVRKDEIAKYNAKYYNTKEGRASNLINNYKREDKKYNRGDCDLTVPWFIENIFTKCIYCGESDWKKLGCDRIDNDLPHTMENVVPCCVDCNRNRQKKPFEQFYWEMKHEKTLGDES